MITLDIRTTADKRWICYNDDAYFLEANTLYISPLDENDVPDWKHARPPFGLVVEDEIEEESRVIAEQLGATGASPACQIAPGYATHDEALAASTIDAGDNAVAILLKNPDGTLAFYAWTGGDGGSDLRLRTPSGPIHLTRTITFDIRTRADGLRWIRRDGLAYFLEGNELLTCAIFLSGEPDWEGAGPPMYGTIEPEFEEQDYVIAEFLGATGYNPTNQTAVGYTNETDALNASVADVGDASSTAILKGPTGAFSYYAFSGYDDANYWVRTPSGRIQLTRSKV